MFAAYQPRAASAYQRINVETSMHTIDQHQLVSLLYEGVLSSIATARGALARGDVLTKCNSVSKAVRIIEEGLMTALDRDAGGELAQNLEALYDYSLRRLLLANAHNDDAMLAEVAHLFEPIAQGWNQIKTPTAAAVAPRAEVRVAAMAGA
ncbi:flagellar protein FliS [Paenacidovorax caeni]|uniref:Flagellar secretion chaperone FliS n=1 Tax=Paenacidovorax caeni TaxID=343013 RepID=A0A1I7K7A2_9BURK|nr:flagellar export chaperone FliS [Paenacidovorax caeni]SFU93276.1 flagellar protein FliS [Paenacidovorax caeni]